MVAEFSKQQLSRTRLNEIQKQFGVTVFQKNGIYLEEDNAINDAIARQVFGDQEKREYDFKHEHHYFHAVCASHLSPYDESIVITWDGGGFNTHFDGAAWLSRNRRHLASQSVIQSNQSGKDIRIIVW